ncbi:MAG: hypothetical protein EOM55_02490 [Clostridia bacterium]|nr:hypothetical protein [Clostridia bacterium]
MLINGYGTINWSSLLVVSALGILGLWVAFSFLNKNGLFLFSVLAIALSTMLSPALIYGPLSMSIVLLPLVFFALFICYEKYGKDDAQRLFYISLITIGVLFVFSFFQAAYLDAEFNMQFFLSWDFIGGYIALAVAYASAGFGTYFLNSKISWKKMNKYLRRSLIISIASVINCILFVFLSNIGSLAFGSIILLMFIAILITTSVSFAVAYLAKYLNRKPIIEITPDVTAEEKAEKAEQEAKEVKDKE